MISIHAPRTGSDEYYQGAVSVRAIFQSTLPARGATRSPHRLGNRHRISIHAPRTGSDCAMLRWWGRDGHFNPRSPHGERRHGRPHRHLGQDFNPRSPHGERRASLASESPSPKFQSTLPARGATIDRVKPYARNAFQSTLPARGATTSPGSSPMTFINFNPRSPHGERRGRTTVTWSRKANFNPRSPHGERLNVKDAEVKSLDISIHAPRTGSDGLRLPIHTFAE